MRRRANTSHSPSPSPVEDELGPYRIETPRTDLAQRTLSVSRGKSNWAFLKQAQQCLWSQWMHDTSLFSVRHRVMYYFSDSWDVWRPILPRIDPSINARSLASPVDYYLHHPGLGRNHVAHMVFDYASGTILLNCILSGTGGSLSTYSEFMKAWPDLVFDEWKKTWRPASKSVADLNYYLVDGPSPFKGDVQVMNYTLYTEQNLIQIIYPGASLVRFTPNDDTFFALLGTNVGSAFTDMLTFHAKDFATSNGAMRKVKSIREVILSVSAKHADDSLFVVNGTGQQISMLIVLEDIDPPQEDEM